MPTREHEFEFLTLEEQKTIIKSGEFINMIKEEGFNIVLYYCEKSYFVEVYFPDGEEEIDFIVLAYEARILKYTNDLKGYKFNLL